MDSLAELKKIILSINGNITNDDIGTFQKQLSQLGQQYEEAPTVTSSYNKIIKLEVEKGSSLFQHLF